MKPPALVKTKAWIAPLLLACGAAVMAGGWHQGSRLYCDDCHTIHNSADGQPMRYDGVATPAPYLLRAEDGVHLCLACHDGSRPGAPDVVAPVAYVTDPAGGWFAQNPLGQANPHGHDLLPSSPQTAPGGPDTLTLSCFSCHDAHGSSSYRNLLLEPPGSSNTGPAQVIADQQVAPDGANADVVYVPANLLYRSGMSTWCNDCHGDFHGRTGSETGTGEPWLRHPQDEPLSGAYGADYNHWAGSIPNRVPVETPGDDVIPSTDDRVFCLSCHKAHGSANRYGLIFADGAGKLSTCQQCHNQ